MGPGTGKPEPQECAAAKVSSLQAVLELGRRPWAPLGPAGAAKPANKGIKGLNSLPSG